jgi:hypothetical protein
MAMSEAILASERSIIAKVLFDVRGSLKVNEKGAAACFSIRPAGSAIPTRSI